MMWANLCICCSWLLSVSALQQHAQRPESVGEVSVIDDDSDAFGAGMMSELEAVSLRKGGEYMEPLQLHQTLRDMQKFISAQPDGVATLVLMGDSTMAGVANKLLNISREVLNTLELAWIHNDRPSKSNYVAFKWRIQVPAGAQMVSSLLTEADRNDPLIRDALERARNSAAALHDKGCKTGGGLETYVFRTGPYKNLVVHHWGFIPEYTDRCWDRCMTDAMRALQPSAVLWNTGFHLLNHDFTPSICRQRHNPTKKNCGDYKQMVKMASEQMLASGIPTVVWKTTNWVCEARQDVGFPLTARGMKKWHNEALRPKLEKTCAQECPDYQGMKCYDWFFDARNSERMYAESMEAIGEVNPRSKRRLHILDAFNVTRRCCDSGCESETRDGEHYDGLDNELASQFAAILAQSA